MDSWFLSGWEDTVFYDENLTLASGLFKIWSKWGYQSPGFLYKKATKMEQNCQTLSISFIQTDLNEVSDDPPAYEYRVVFTKAQGESDTNLNNIRERCDEIIQSKRRRRDSAPPCMNLALLQELAKNVQETDGPKTNEQAVDDTSSTLIQADSRTTPSDRPITKEGGAGAAASNSSQNERRQQGELETPVSHQTVQASNGQSQTRQPDRDPEVSNDHKPESAVNLGNVTETGTNVSTGAAGGQESSTTVTKPQNTPGADSNLPGETDEGKPADPRNVVSDNVSLPLNDDEVQASARNISNMTVGEDHDGPLIVDDEVAKLEAAFINAQSDNSDLQQKQSHANMTNDNLETANPKTDTETQETLTLPSVTPPRIDKVSLKFPNVSNFAEIQTTIVTTKSNDSDVAVLALFIKRCRAIRVGGLTGRRIYDELVKTMEDHEAPRNKRWDFKVCKWHFDDENTANQGNTVADMIKYGDFDKLKNYMEPCHAIYPEMHVTLPKTRNRRSNSITKPVTKIVNSILNASQGILERKKCAADKLTLAEFLKKKADDVFEILRRKSDDLKALCEEHGKEIVKHSFCQRLGRGLVQYDGGNKVMAHLTSLVAGMMMFQ